MNFPVKKNKKKKFFFYFIKYIEKIMGNDTIITSHSNNAPRPVSRSHTPDPLAVLRAKSTPNSRSSSPVPSIRSVHFQAPPPQPPPKEEECKKKKGIKSLSSKIENLECLVDKVELLEKKEQAVEESLSKNIKQIEQQLKELRIELNDLIEG
jgi:hypothetical protein